jgi:hypothetical protein
MCKLWKAKSRYRELNFVPLLVSHPTSQFSGGSLHNLWRTPNPHRDSTSTSEAFDLLWRGLCAFSIA